MAELPEKIRKKIEYFHKDKGLQKRFSRELEQIILEEVIWPQNYSFKFTAEFRVQYRNVIYPYPLVRPEDRIFWIEQKIKTIGKKDPSRQIHPALAYYFLTLYQYDFKPSAPTYGRKKAIHTKKRLTAKEKKQLEKEKQNKKIYNKIQKVKNKLSVSVKLKKARTAEELLQALIGEFQRLTTHYYRQKKSLDALKADVSMYKNPEYMHSEIKKIMEALIAENTRQKISVEREKKNTQVLEKEVNRLAEQIISVPYAQTDDSSHKMDNLKREYTILSHKYDNLVNRNIELVNRLDKIRTARSLEQLLDHIRDKINGVLRAGVKQSDDLLVKSIRNEIQQLQRSRIYLGRALYDVGMLYLRTGRKNDAIIELKAARELGIEDQEINKLLNA